jgi:hypothetical protein
MDFQIEKNFQELFKKVSDQEVERNPALCRQTEKLRRALSQFNNPEAKAEVPPQKKSGRSLFSVVGEYALLK